MKWLSGVKIRHYSSTHNSYDHTRLTLHKSDKIKINHMHICSKTSVGQAPEYEDKVMGMTEKSSLLCNWLQCVK